ncbi:ankyrin repeat and MYND domain-containing protein 2-like [Orbicella faveolata]|uniref:ankyrin repeat and MYND domain-containing protein 2-like n=1 Tax=Orbicella faveolata TaxID=48498 RepID=UPI0009E44055|nr:ankyrin repeat and MYND domain-containing protein 2-like [Orbicella faveolata]
MFACLSGSVDTTRVLLEAGAKVNAENNLGRTAAQLGAFVGQSDCVSLINNFLAVEDLEYYTKPQGLEKEPKLSTALVPMLHKYAVSQKLSPVKIAMYLQDNLELVTNYKSLVKVMELIVESNIKSSEMNEVLAMKIHYLAFTLKKCARWHEGLDGKDGIDGFIKYRFGFTQGREPTALTVLTQSINGLRCGDFSDCCGVCTENRNVKKCSACKTVGYCSVRCQKLHWQTHKKFCKQLAKEYEEMLAAKLAEEKLDQEMKNKGVNKTVVNGNAGENLNTENSETEKDEKTDTQPHSAMNGTSPEPTENQTSSVPEEKA